MVTESLAIQTLVIVGYTSFFVGLNFALDSGKEASDLI